MIRKFYTVLLSLLFVTNTPLFAQDINGTLDHDGVTRSYVLHVPANYDPGFPVPLVLALHGLGDMATNFSNVGLSQVADQEDFFVVYPQAVADPIFGAAWNNGAGSLGIVINASVDDVGFLDALIDQIATEYVIDLERVYCTGFSMGGIMTHRMACEMSHRLAAVASVAGPLPDASAANCPTERPMPVMHMHGTADGVVAYADGSFSGFDAGLTGAEETVDFWKTHNGCDEVMGITMLPDTAADGYTIETWDATGCEEDGRALLYKIEGADHTWLQSNNDVDANVEIWNFFDQYALDLSTVSAQTIPTAMAKAFPNPFTDQLALEVPEGQFERATLFTMTGQQVADFSIAGNNGKILLNVQDLNTGNYFLRLTGKTVQTVKLQKI